jgi:propanol-preferring alcohol dehydrogenase
MKMQAARMYGYNEPLRIDEVPVPEPAPEEILLKVAACGMCRSDYQVVVNPSWGDGTCRQCREGNEQLCSGSGRWVGFGPPGGFAEYMTVESRHAIPVSADAAKSPEYLAPMTDAGMTPFRG